jgi:NTP pyrophosphatase (non-canonical NTP hydrolase)
MMISEKEFLKLVARVGLGTDAAAGLIQNRIRELQSSSGGDRMTEVVLESHRELCAVKKMGEKAAFGHDPAVFYGLALAGEAGELANKLIRAIRSGGPGELERKKEAIRSEIADVLIYGILLAYTNDIDPLEEVVAKTQIVVQRAIDGYYGGAL